VQLAVTRTDIALNAPVLEEVPVAAWPAVCDRFSRPVAHDAILIGLVIEGEQSMRPRAADLVTRPPAVAGHFYDADPHQLRSEVRRLLGMSMRPMMTCRPKAIIAPHAAYLYSGQVAATAFATLDRSVETIQRVVLIGPAHYVPFHGLAVPTVEAFETPLGPVPLDHDALAAVAQLPSVKSTDAPHSPEHALEVELPFLQELLPRLMAVPLLVGDAIPSEVAAALNQLWGGPETVIVVSSDLSHFHNDETARRRDAATADMIERGAWTRLAAGNACGYLAIAGLLIEATRRGLNATRLSLCNSGDTAGSRDRVVGYGAWMFDDSSGVRSQQS
jgi:MEMO1 family protein